MFPLIVGKLRQFADFVVPTGSYRRFAIIVILAAGIAYTIAKMVPHASPLIAAVTAVVSMKPTTQKSVRESFHQLAGIVAGIVLALSLVRGFGNGPIVLCVSLGIGFALSRLVSKDAEDSIPFVVSILLIVGTNFVSITSAEGRAFGVFIGAIAAISLSMLIHSGSPVQRALLEVTRISENIANTLRDMGQTVASGIPDQTVSREWLETLASCRDELRKVRVEAVDIVKSSNWTPFVRKQEAVGVLQQVDLVESTNEIVFSVARDLFFASGVGSNRADAAEIPLEVTDVLGGVLHSTANMLSTQASEALLSPARPVDVDSPLVQEAVLLTSSAAGKVKNVEQTGALILGGSLLRDSRKLQRILTESQEK